MTKKYFYANGQVIAQHIDDYYDFCFYLHDRLGNVREVINTSPMVVNTYTYEPFGTSFTSEQAETVPNSFMFTGQYFDKEIAQYYLRARQYDPQLYRFTARDPVQGKFTEPLTLHVYLYCANDPINRIDPDGKFMLLAAKLVIGGIMGGFSAYRDSGGDMWATALGSVLGMFSAAIPAPMLGAVIGAVSSGGSAAFASYRNGDDFNRMVIKGMSSFLAGATGGTVGAIAHVKYEIMKGWAGVGADVGNAVLSDWYGSGFTSVYDAWSSLFEQREEAIDKIMEGF